MRAILRSSGDCSDGLRSSNRVTQLPWALLSRDGPRSLVQAGLHATVRISVDPREFPFLDKRNRRQIDQMDINVVRVGRKNHPTASHVLYPPACSPATPRSPTMMFSGKLFAAILAVAAVGVTGSAVELEKRDWVPGNVTYCTAPDFTVKCVHIAADRVCHNLASFIDSFRTEGSKSDTRCALWS